MTSQLDKSLDEITAERRQVIPLVLPVANLLSTLRTGLVEVEVQGNMTPVVQQAEFKRYFHYARRSHKYPRSAKTDCLIWKTYTNGTLYLQRRIDSYSSPGARRNTRKSDDTWTHDLFDRNGGDKRQLANNPLAIRLGETYYFLQTTKVDWRKPRPARLRVENLHYELTEDDLLVFSWSDFMLMIGFVQRNWTCREFKVEVWSGGKVWWCCICNLLECRGC